MASARARLGAARRGLIGRQKKTDLFSGILGTVGTVAAFAGTQAKKAKTAWGEYEAGYKALGGTEPIDKGGWFNRTFKGPGEGEVQIGERMYDKGQIQKSGSFLGSDASNLLGETGRKKYIERAKGQGTLITGERLGDYLQGGGRPQTTDGVVSASGTRDTSTSGWATDTTYGRVRQDPREFTGGVEAIEKKLWASQPVGEGAISSPDTSIPAYKVPSNQGQPYTYGAEGMSTRTVSPVSGPPKSFDYKTAMAKRYDPTRGIEKRTFRGEDGQPISEVQTQEMMDEARTRQTGYLSQIQQVPETQDMSQGFLQKIGQGIKQKFSDIGAQKWQQSERERIEAEKQRIWGPSYKERKSAWETSRGQ